MMYSLAFILLSIPIILLSLKSFRNKKSHGFYRFFSWEAILILLVFKIEFWFSNPFSFHQIISWILLSISLWFVVAGFYTLKTRGKFTSKRNQTDLYQFEKTSELVQTGIYKYIRHPLYSSLLFLTWGIYLKQPDLILLHVAIFASMFLFFTARADEKECINYFGKDYLNYIEKSKRFIPFIF